jgi:DNA helicase-2/ATP-dependent DNA helicase PcrA
MSFSLDELNDQQRRAVEHIDGPMLILAGAGSGKTRVITNRVAYLIQWGINPSNILALSFTNKASEEMRQRVAELTGPKLAEDVYLSTFHSLGADILRRDIDILDYDKPFTILDQNDQVSVVEEAMRELDIDRSAVAPPKLLSMISRAKMEFREPQALADFKYDPHLPRAQKVYERYKRALRGLNAVDFDDLLCLPIKIFRENEAVRNKYGERFQYVMVDEYQDTNRTQLILLQELVRDHHNLCVVGDDDQSIYGFRGALAENILEFENMFEETEVIKLEQNYRSTNTILEAANALIRHNDVRKQKELWSARGEGTPVRLVTCEDGEEEAEYVAAEIERLRSEHNLRYDDIAILYRVNPQATPFEKSLSSMHIPYQVRGSTEFFDRKEVKDFVAYLRAALNPKDELNLRRIVNVPRRGIGPTLLERISTHAGEESMTFFEALRCVGDDPDRIDGIGYGVAKHLSRFVETLETFHRRLTDYDSGDQADDDDTSLAEICQSFLDDIDLADHVRSQEQDDHRARRRVSNLDELIESIRRFERNSDAPLRKFLESISLDKHRYADEGSDENAVQLMTLHSSKGLEFPAVFVVGMEEGYLPHSENRIKHQDVAEERRLAYVGMTRAQRWLTLTNASSRNRYGQQLDREASRFLDELPDEHIRGHRAADRESLEKEREERTRKYLDKMHDMLYDE